MADVSSISVDEARAFLLDYLENSIGENFQTRRKIEDFLQNAHEHFIMCLYEYGIEQIQNLFCSLMDVPLGKVRIFENNQNTIQDIQMDNSSMSIIEDIIITILVNIYGHDKSIDIRGFFNFGDAAKTFMDEEYNDKCRLRLLETGGDGETIGILSTSNEEDAYGETYIESKLIILIFNR